jgi:AAA domain
MTEATGFEAKTIHWPLEVDPKGGGFKRGDDNPLDCDLLVVDEASMVDVMLMQALMKAQSAGRRLHSRAQPRLTKCSMLWGRRGDVDLLVDPLRHPVECEMLKPSRSALFLSSMLQG